MYALNVPIQLNSLLLSLTLIQANISNSKLDPVLIKHWQSRDVILEKIIRWFETNRQLIGAAFY